MTREHRDGTRTWRTMRIALAKIVVAAFLLQLGCAIAAPLAAEDDQPLTAVLDGKVFPLTIKARDLPKDYKAVTLTYPGGEDTEYISEVKDAIASVYRGQPGGKSEASMSSRLSAMWTRCEIVVVDGIRYYVLYAFNLTDVDFARIYEEGPSVPVIESLRLRLVKVDSVVALTPLGDLRPCDDSEGAEDAVRAKSMYNLKLLGNAMMMYTNDYDGITPYPQQTKTCFSVLTPYMRSIKCCTPPRTGTQYLFNMNIGGVQISDISPPKDTPMFWEEMPWPDGSHLVCFADGHVSAIPSDAWPQVEAMLKKEFERVPDIEPLRPDYGIDEYERMLDSRHDDG